MTRNARRLLFTPWLLVLGGAWLVCADRSEAAPIFRYSLPQSWPGPPETLVEDLSAAGNDATVAGSPALSASIPPGADPTTQSLDSREGGFQTMATGLLNNADVAAVGGFRYDVSFLWDGSAGSFPVQKIIDYAGTESLQIGDVDTAAGTATLNFRFNDDDASQLTLPIEANQWYDVTATFNTLGNAVAGDGSLSGLATLTVDGASVSQAMTKSDLGDGLNRPIGVGTFAVAGGIIQLEGLLHDPAVTLIPEPSGLGLLLTGAAALLWRSNRRIAPARRS